MKLKAAPVGRLVDLTGASRGLKYEGKIVPETVRVSGSVTGTPGIIWVTDGTQSFPLHEDLECKIHTEGQTR